jgi:formylglycine-generating enzyme required for sulfatase activity
MCRPAPMRRPDRCATRHPSFRQLAGNLFPAVRGAVAIVLPLLFGAALPVSHARGQGGGALASGEVGKEWPLDIGEGQKLRMCYCPAGSFTMGTPAGELKYVEPRETPVEVTLTAPFWLSRTEVTQAQWVAVMGRNPSAFKGANLPVDTVNWNDCQEFIRRLNARGGLPAGWAWALPTEAQWEYACRAGEKGPYSGGTLDAVGWYLGNADRTTQEVAMKKPNSWGLHDMHGNVLEWCADWMGESLPGGTDPRGPDACAFGDFRVLRGGSWDRPPQACRAAIRFWSRDGDNRTGFRPALVPSR